jgi:hypothetical protein
MHNSFIMLILSGTLTTVWLACDIHIALGGHFDTDGCFIPVSIFSIDREISNTVWDITRLVY